MEDVTDLLKPSLINQLESLGIGTYEFNFIDLGETDRLMQRIGTLQKAGYKKQQYEPDDSTAITNCGDALEGIGETAVYYAAEQSAFYGLIKISTTQIFLNLNYLLGMDNGIVKLLSLKENKAVVIESFTDCNGKANIEMRWSGAEWCEAVKE